jgi:hypothetical protein
MTIQKKKSSKMGAAASARESELNAEVHAVAVSKSRTAIPVPVLCVGKQSFTGPIVHHAPRLGKVMQLAMERKNERFTHRAQILVATFDVADFEWALQCALPLFTLRTVLVVAKAQALPSYLRVDRTFAADARVWSVLSFKHLPAPKRVDQLVAERCQLERYSTVYYVSSARRELAVREAYAADTRFDAQTSTGIIHATVLKAMFPGMHISIGPGANQPFAALRELHAELFG